MDAQDEGMGDAGEWREFVLWRLLRELVEKAGRAETVEDLANTRKEIGPAVHSAPGSPPGGVVELADAAGPTMPALTARRGGSLYVRDGGGEKPESAEQAITGWLSQALAKSVPWVNRAGDNQCSLRFFQPFPIESWRVRP